MATEQKAEAYDKVEPKFKVGDWILIDRVCQVKSIDNFGNYVIQYCDSDFRERNVLSKKFCESYFHLWTIQDAKDGDVLVCNDNPFLFSKYEKDGYGLVCCSYCGISGYGEFVVNTNSKKYWCDIEFVKPATKEQRDTLMKAMTDAGYSFDFEEKELKITDFSKHLKYDPNAPSITKQNPSWSEEDAIMLGKCIDAASGYYLPEDKQNMKDWLRAIKDRVLPQQKQEWKEEDETKLKFACALIRNTSLKGNDEIVESTIDWLKFLKCRVQPQLKQEWSEEDEQNLTKCLEALIAQTESVDLEIINKEWKPAINWLKSLRPQPKQEWKQENVEELSDFENAMMHIGESFFGENAGLDPNDTNAIKEQANLLLELVSKPEWSKEDMNIIDGMIMDYEGEIEHLSNSTIDEQAKPIYQERINFLNRLKSLRHVKQEWSEEDEKMLNQIISIIKDADDDLIRAENISIYTNWLKSRVQPQLKWKPSELQIEALESATENCAYSEYQDCLKELIVELKKLTE